MLVCVNFCHHPTEQFNYISSASLSASRFFGWSFVQIHLDSHLFSLSVHLLVGSLFDRLLFTSRLYLSIFSSDSPSVFDTGLYKSVFFIGVCLASSRISGCLSSSRVSLSSHLASICILLRSLSSFSFHRSMSVFFTGFYQSSLISVCLFQSLCWPSSWVNICTSSSPVSVSYLKSPFIFPSGLSISLFHRSLFVSLLYGYPSVFCSSLRLPVFSSLPLFSFMRMYLFILLTWSLSASFLHGSSYVCLFHGSLSVIFAGLCLLQWFLSINSDLGLFSS